MVVGLSGAEYVRSDQGIYFSKVILFRKEEMVEQINGDDFLSLRYES